MTVRRALGLAVGAVTAALVLGACGSGTYVPPTTSSPLGPQVPTGAAADTAFAAPGPYSAGTAHYVVNGDRVVVWYPASKVVAHGPGAPKPYRYHLRSWLPAALAKIIPAKLDDVVVEDAYAGVKAAAGRFPVVLFSHGFGGYPEQSSFLTAHLATWGFVVVAPDQTARDLAAVTLGARYTPADARLDVTQMEAALAFVEGLGTTPGATLYGHVDDALVATLGHSAGGLTAVATAEADPAIKAVVALAGVPTTPPSRPLPILLMSGSADKVVPTSGIRSFYDQLLAPKAMVVIDGAGHNVFDDVCTIAHRQGGIEAAARALKLPVPPSLLGLATDGCRPPDIYPPRAYGLIDQAVVAAMRYGLGVDRTPVGLGPGLDSAFPGVRASFVGAGIP